MHSVASGLGRARDGGLLAVGVGCLLLAVGCTADTSGQEYFSVRADVRRCAAPLCGGYFVQAVNRSATLCADGSEAQECYVAELDISGLGAPPGAAPALVRGDLEPKDFEGFGNLGRLRAVEAWRAAGPGPGELSFYRVVDNGVRCVTTPCFSWSAEWLNSEDVQLVSAVELGLAGAPPEAQEQAYAELSRGRLLVSAVPAPSLGPNGGATVLSADQFYLPLGGEPCQADGDCARGELCNAESVCLPPPGCSAGELCPQVCSGFCVEDAAAGESGCGADADCASGSWCRPETAQSRCVPWAGEGQACEGFRLPEFRQRCSPDLRCDFADPTGDLGGTCRRPCKNLSECRDDQYCAEDGLCHRDGACETLADCRAEGNLYPVVLCGGTLVCQGGEGGGFGAAEGSCRMDCSVAPGPSDPAL